ncbi:MAG: flavodoxin domain-containing protein [Armatimonadota bacterium]|nr:NAD(P)H-dependent oxidoreductase [Armatimonadota bacterium]MCX7778094.1 NAD(P)H-dependent oxidoreductase [Armatimonadota bacterium]MDW8025478.1 flavodoxin domain-containing protein [Armatimonadota bacterium]
MAKKRLLIIYYSGTGNTKMLANEIAAGARAKGVTVRVKCVEDCTVQDLREADALAVGSPTYFSNVAWQIKKFIDESIALYEDKVLSGKPVGIFTSAGCRRDAQQCLKMLQLAFAYHHSMKLIEPMLIRVDGEPDEQAKANARAYGERIAEALLSR